MVPISTQQGSNRCEPEVRSLCGMSLPTSTSMGLARVKNTLPGKSVRSQDRLGSQTTIAAISGLVPTMFMTRVKIVGQDRESHPCGHFWERSAN